MIERTVELRLPAEPPKDLDAMLQRLHLPTVRRLHAELAQRAEAEGMSYRTYLETLVAEEIAHRAETRLRRAVRAARSSVDTSNPAIDRHRKTGHHAGGLRLG